MGRPKKLEDGERLSVVLPKKQVDQIRRRALQMSVQEGRTITVSEALRMAVEMAYPLPKQTTLF